MYHIRDAVFRPRYETSPPETSQSNTFSLNIHPLGELVDMYHNRKATKLQDKVYALLGMSSDDPRTAGLSADYEMPWPKVFQKLIQFSLSYQVFVDTWDNSVVAVIQGKGHILGRVSSVGGNNTPGDVQRIRIVLKNALGHFDTEEKKFDLRPSAKRIHKGDIVCLLQGASKPTIVRLCNGYSAIIMIATPLLKDTGLWERLRSIRTPIDFVMIWDWDAFQQGSQNQDYESFISSQPGRQDCMAKAIRSWNFGELLNGTERYADARIHLQKAVEMYSLALRSKDNYPGEGAWIEADKEVLEAIGSLVVRDQDALIGPHNFNSQIPLLWAAEKGYEGIAKLLLEKGAAIEVKSSTGQTPLLWAAEKGYEGITKLLVEKGAAIKVKSSTGQTPLLWAVEKGYEGITKLLLEKGANVNAQGGHFGNALQAASSSGYDKIVQILLEKGADVNAQGGYFGNALQAASSSGYDKIVQILLEKGADVNAQGGHFGNALQAASFKGHDKIVQILLEKGADVNAQGGYFGNALQAASSRGYDKIVQILREKVANQ